MKVFVQTSVGELVDKITILELKAKNFNNREKLFNVEKELAVLEKELSALKLVDSRFNILRENLAKINQNLWDIEDQIRLKEKSQSFDLEFINLARSVYKTNDQRALLKKQINELSGSDLTEEKSYSEY